MQPVTPSTPDSAGVVIIDGTATVGNVTAANERRNKTIMNCFRDRTPSYTRSNSRTALAGGGSVGVNVVGISNRSRPEAVVYLKEPPRYTRHYTNKLSLLTSASSTRDINRLMTTDITTTTTKSSLTTIASSSLSSSSSSSISSMSTMHHPQQQQQQQHYQLCTTCGSSHCKRFTTTTCEVEKRLSAVEKTLQDQESYSKMLESKIGELTKRVEDLSELRRVEKRKKSMSQRNKKQSTNDNGGVQPSKFVAWMNLSNLWKHRPSIETLKEQNIYNDEPCFDTEIEMVLKHELHKTVPKIIVDCCDLIEMKYRTSTQPIEGIYRQCGDYNKIQTLRFRIDANDYDALRHTNIDIHTLTGVMKLFLREIKSPLVSANEAKTFIGKPNQWLLSDLPTKIETLQRLIRSLPEVNRDTMEYLFAHFNRLTKVPLQQVSADTLSLSVTPSIFHTVQQGAHMQDIHVLMKESEILADCVKIMIEYQSRIFECITDRKYRRISVRNLKKTLSHPDLIFQNLF